MTRGAAMLIALHSPALYAIGAQKEFGLAEVPPAGEDEEDQKDFRGRAGVLREVWQQWLEIVRHPIAPEAGVLG